MKKTNALEILHDAMAGLDTTQRASMSSFLLGSLSAHVDKGGVDLAKWSESIQLARAFVVLPGADGAAVAS